MAIQKWDINNSYLREGWLMWSLLLLLLFLSRLGLLLLGLLLSLFLNFHIVLVDVLSLNLKWLLWLCLTLLLLILKMWFNWLIVILFGNGCSLCELENTATHYRSLCVFWVLTYFYQFFFFLFNSNWLMLFLVFIRFELWRLKTGPIFLI